jgi:uncharacterized protein (UPF0332 family)
MAYERLLKSGRIQPYAAQPSEVSQLLQVSERDLVTASKNLDDAADWAYTIAYNAVLQASRALMLHAGFRPRGGEQHATVVEFMEEYGAGRFEKQARLFDQMRRKRHRLVYEVAGLVSRAEAQQAIAFAQGFFENIRAQITGQQRLLP